MRTFPTVTRFAITHLDTVGVRALTFANQGRNHYDDRAQAEAALQAYLPSLTARADGRSGFQVTPVECYTHGDAVGSYALPEACEACGSLCDKGEMHLDGERIFFSRTCTVCGRVHRAE